MRLWLTAIALTAALSTSVYAQMGHQPQDKIKFDLNQLDEYGLYGPTEGKRSLSYEFCVPNEHTTVSLVQAIDPTVILYLYSPGRIGCTAAEMLAIGHTHQPNYREVLINLARLDAVERIEPFWGE